MKIPTIMNEDGRKAWSFMALVGAGMVFTLFAAFAVWNLRNSSGFTFWLGLAAHGQVFMVLGALGWALGRRMLGKVTREGAEFDDRPAPPPSTLPQTTEYDTAEPTQED